jgi:hypothetical protein
VDVLEERDGHRFKRVLSDATCSDKNAARAMAKAPIGELTELGWVVHARNKGVRGEVFAGGIVEGLAGELLGAGDSRGAVAPGRATWSWLAGLATLEVVEGDGLGPPRGVSGVALPAVEPLADPAYGCPLIVHHDALEGGEGEQGKGAGDAVGDAVVAVPALGRRAVLVGTVAAPPAGQIAARFSEPDDVVEHVAQDAVLADATENHAQSREAADEVVLGVRRLLVSVDAAVGGFKASSGDVAVAAVAIVRARARPGSSELARTNARAGAP